MLKSKKLNLNGLEIDGSTPITPRTKEFLVSKGIHVAQDKDGYISVTGSFSISGQEVSEFLASKKSVPVARQ